MGTITCHATFFIVCFSLNLCIHLQNNCIISAFLLGNNPTTKKSSIPIPTLRHPWSLPYTSSPSSSEENKKSSKNNNDPSEKLSNNECSLDDPDCNALQQASRIEAGIKEDIECDYNDEDCIALQQVYLYKDLHNRENQLQMEKRKIMTEQTRNNWKKALCIKSVGVTLTDWVRRVAIDEYPIAVCGSKRGSVFVSNLEEGLVLAHALEAHDQGCDVVRGGKKVITAFYNGIDDGDGEGPIAVSIRGDLIVSSGREGGVKVWKIDGGSQNSNGAKIENDGEELQFLGSIRGLEKILVTSLKFDKKGRLWAGCSDGTIQVYDVDGTSPKRLFTGYFQDSILDLCLCEEIGVGVCATIDGFAALFSLEDGEFIQSCGLFDSGVAARSVLVTNDSETTENRWSVMCGGMNGDIHRLRLNVDQSTGKVVFDDPFIVHEDTPTQMKPSHKGPVVSLVSPTNGIFISGSLSGKFRVWDCSYASADIENDESDSLPHSLYDLAGENSSLGNVCTDGSHLISDGCMSPTLIVHDFTAG